MIEIHTSYVTGNSSKTNIAKLQSMKLDMIFFLIKNQRKTILWQNLSLQVVLTLYGKSYF